MGNCQIKSKLLQLNISFNPKITGSAVQKLHNLQLLILWGNKTVQATHVSHLPALTSLKVDEESPIIQENLKLFILRASKSVKSSSISHVPALTFVPVCDDSFPIEKNINSTVKLEIRTYYQDNYHKFFATLLPEEIKALDAASNNLRDGKGNSRVIMAGDKLSCLQGPIPASIDINNPDITHYITKGRPLGRQMESGKHYLETNYVPVYKNSTQIYRGDPIAVRSHSVIVNLLKDLL